MPTTVDLAELSDAAYGYDDQAIVAIPMGQAPSGVGTRITWRREDHIAAPNGFFGALYVNEANEYVVAFRGTEFVDGFGDDVLGDDIDIALGRMPPQAVNAIAFTDKHSKHNPILTGHSLGGGLAIIAAARFGLPAVTFNAPGMEDSCQMTAKNLQSGDSPVPNGLIAFSRMVAQCESNPRIRNIRIGGDPVSNYFLTGNQPGETTTYRENQCSNYSVAGYVTGGIFGGLALQAFCRHKMSTVISVIRGRSDSYHLIDL